MGFWKWTTLLLSLTVMSGIAALSYFAMHSDLFIVSSVEVEYLHPQRDAEYEWPVSVQQIQEATGLRLGKDNLYGLSLAKVEKKLKQLSWIRSVDLSKSFPQTLKISVRLKEARAIEKSASGDLLLIDDQGERIAALQPQWSEDLPVVSSQDQTATDKKMTMMGFLQTWDEIHPELNPAFRISSLNYLASGNMEVWLSYSIVKKEEKQTILIKASLDPLEVGDFKSAASRIHKVLEYLSKHNIASHQLSLTSEQKIVVTTKRVS